MERIEVIFQDGSAESFPAKHLTGVLYGITRLEQTPVLPFLGVELIREDTGRVLWPTSEVLKWRANALDEPQDEGEEKPAESESG